MKREQDFQIGEECVYRETEGELRCLILSKSFDREGRELHLELRVKEIFRTAFILDGEARIGQVFKVWKVLDAGIDEALFWRISEELILD